ncbi:MAG: YggS family pyridoxal phosphate-dependent enzyme [Methylocapsa sp.]|nr:YggS family pyridoxal phosphate-dependent enzyme [Methylocapsa sp.]
MLLSCKRDGTIDLNNLPRLAPNGKSKRAKALQRQLASGTALDRLAQVRARIARAARDAGRLAQEVSLVCASKSFAPEEIGPVIEAGERVFGENRIQEALGKWPRLKETYAGIELHLIGPLQSNKTHQAISFFDVIETIDRDKIAKCLAQEIQKTSHQPKLFVQVNTGAEPQKSGVLPQEADRFIDACRKTYGLSISGLMCIPPLGEPASPHFALLNLIATRNGLRELSMGMSDDFELAIELGATSVRIGSAIFGAR